MNLPTKEFQLLFLLCTHPRQIYTRESIIEKFGVSIIQAMKEQ